MSSNVVANASLDLINCVRERRSETFTAVFMVDNQVCRVLVTTTDTASAKLADYLDSQVAAGELHSLHSDVPTCDPDYLRDQSWRPQVEYETLVITSNDEEPVLRDLHDWHIKHQPSNVVQVVPRDISPSLLRVYNSASPSNVIGWYDKDTHTMYSYYTPIA